MCGAPHEEPTNKFSGAPEVPLAPIQILGLGL